jgi:hypothetical protein
MTQAAGSGRPAACEIPRLLHELKYKFQRELDLPRRRARPTQRTGAGIYFSRPVEDVCVGGRGRRGKVGVIKNVKELRAELYIEVLGNFLDVVVLEHGEVRLSYAWTDQNIATGIASKIEALQERDLHGRSVARLEVRRE